MTNATDGRRSQCFGIHPLTTEDIQMEETREKIEAFLKESGAQLWIQHDYAANAKLKKAPQFYE